MRTVRKIKFGPRPELRGLFVTLALVAVVLTTVSADQGANRGAARSVAPALKPTSHPVYFEANGGQLPADVGWRLRGTPYVVDVAADRVSFTSAAETPVGSVPPHVMRLVDANPTAESTGTGGQAGHVHYLKGSRPSAWVRDIEAYPAVHYTDIYPGVDLDYYGNRNRLEYDFVVAPGADPAQIRLGFDEARSVSINTHGDLVIDYAWGTVVQQAPHIYQQKNQQQTTVAGRYRLGRDNVVGFDLAAYDPALPLVIDPVLVYASFYGGTGDDRINSMVRDTAGNLYLAGVTTSTDYPASGSASGDRDIFVTKLDNTGALVYSVYIGGTQDDFARDIAVDSASGEVYVTGATISDDFPTTAGTVDDVCAPVTAEDTQTYCADDWQAFVVKLDNAGTINYASYLGGAAADEGYAIDTDGSGNAYVAGTTKSVDFPVTGGVVQSALQGNNATDMFVAKLNATGTALTYATYLGGTQDDVPEDLAVDGSGNVYVAGFTLSEDYPLQNAYDTTCAYDGVCGRDVAGKRVAVAGASGAILTAIPDDTSWTAEASGTANDLNDMTWGQGEYTAVGDSGTILTSVDGTTWTDHSTGTSDLNGLVWGGGQFVAVGVSGTILTSPDGATWTDHSTGSSNLTAVSWSGSQYVAVGMSGAVMTSPDGVTWTAQTSGVTADLNGIAWNGTLFTAVGAVGTIISSSDGVSWVSVTSGSANNLYAIAWSGHAYAAAGAAGTILTSVDGITWVVQSSGVSNDLLSVDWGTNGFAVAGATGMVLLSDGGVNWSQWPTLSAANLRTLVWSHSLVSADAVVTKLDSTAANLLYSTYLGGVGYDFATGIRVDGSNRAYVTGYTLSDDLATAGAYQETRAGSDDAFVARFDASGATLDFLTYLGGRSRDIAEDLAIDASGNMYLTGYTFSTDFPSVNDMATRSGRCTEKPINPVYACNADIFVARVAAGGAALDYSLYIGDIKTDIARAIAIDTSGADTQLYIAGYTNSTAFPVTNSTTHADDDGNGAADQSDAVLVQVSEASGDLAVTVSDAADPLLYGDNVTYTVTATNNGADDVHGVVITDDLPGGVEFVSATPAQGSCSETNGVISCQLGTVAASASVDVTVVGFPKQDGNYDNRVSVSGRVTDTVTANDTDSESTLVNLTPASTTSGSGSLDRISDAVLLLLLLIPLYRGYVRRQDA